MSGKIFDEENNPATYPDWQKPDWKFMPKFILQQIFGIVL
jgi:hypothetical protein